MHAHGISLGNHNGPDGCCCSAHSLKWELASTIMSLLEKVFHTVLYLDINSLAGRPEHLRVVDVSPTLFCSSTN